MIVLPYCDFGASVGRSYSLIWHQANGVPCPSSINLVMAQTRRALRSTDGSVDREVGL